MASALLNLSLGKRERGKEKKEGEKEKGREGEKVRARGATVPGLPSLRNLGSLGAPPLAITCNHGFHGTLEDSMTIGDIKFKREEIWTGWARLLLGDQY